MTVQDHVRAVSVPAPAQPADPPLQAAAPSGPTPAVRPLVGRERPLTADERACAIGLTAMAVVLGTIIVTFLLLSVHVWG